MTFHVDRAILGDPLRLDGIRMMRLLAGLGKVRVFPDAQGIEMIYTDAVDAEPSFSGGYLVSNDPKLIAQAEALGMGCFKEGAPCQSGNVFSVVFLDEIPMIVYAER